MRKITIILWFCSFWSAQLYAQEITNQSVKRGAININGLVFFKAVDVTLHASPEFSYQNNRVMYAGGLLFRTSGRYYTSIHSGNLVDIGAQLSVLYKLNQAEVKSGFLVGVSFLQLHGKLNYKGLATPGNSVWIKSSNASMITAQLRYQLHLGKGWYVSLSESFGGQFSYGKGLPARNGFETTTAMGVGLKIF